MVQLDHAVLHAPDRVAAAHQARRSAPGMPVPFDAIARMAARMTRARSAVVSLVCDDHDDLLGAHGLPAQYAQSRQWPPRHSLCRYVISHGAVLAVADVTADGNLRSHPLVADSAIRAFAGVPLRDSHGRPVGAVTVADTTVRTWTPDDVTALQEIAALLEPIPTQVDAAATLAVLGDYPAPSAAGRPAASVSATVEADVQRGFIAALMDSLPIGVVAFGADRQPVMGNRTLREISDQPPHAPLEGVVASLAARLRRPDGTPMDISDLPVATASPGRTIREAEALLYRPGAPDRHLRCTAAPIVASTGELLGAVGTVTDVTTHRRGQDASLAQGRVAILLNRADGPAAVLPEVLQTTAAAMRWPYASLWLVDVGDVLRCEARWTASGDAGSGPGCLELGEGLIGRAWQEQRTLQSPNASDLCSDAAGSSHEDLPPSGSAAIAAPIHDGDTVVGVLACLVPFREADHTGDVTQLENTGELIGHYIARRRAADLGQQLMRAKDDFVALVGHELRTPVTSIASSVQMLQADGFDDDAPRLLDAIGRNAHTLQQVINDLLDMAQLESQPRPIRFDVVDLAAVVADAAQRAPAAGGPRLHTSLPPTCEIDGDSSRLTQVVENLLSNAMKYTPAGGEVHLSLDLDGDVAVLAVADTGIGIPPEERDHLFRRFYRASNARNSGKSGTGLGLVMIRTIVEAHRGTVHLDPDHDGGTRFVVRLPRRRTTRRRAMATAATA
jgi:signal transduction histidine kinase/PAS domain-containing protein